MNILSNTAPTASGSTSLEPCGFMDLPEWLTEERPNSLNQFRPQAESSLNGISILEMPLDV